MGIANSAFLMYNNGRGHTEFSPTAFVCFDGVSKLLQEMTELMKLDSLMTLPEVQNFPKGTVIVREGDSAGEAMYLLLKGTAAAFQYKDGEQVPKDLYTTGGFFGEIPFFLKKRQPVTIISSSDSAVLVIARQNAPALFSSQPELALSIMEELCRKLESVAYSLEKLNEMFWSGGGVPVADTSSLSQRSSLFPENHGSYRLPLDNGNKECLFEQSVACPMCGHSFKQMTVLFSKLRQTGTDSDLRVRYKDIEPMLYDIITCPSCFYSALSDSFAGTSKRWADRINKEIEPFKAELRIKTGGQRDSFAVFAGFYLAMICAPICFDNPQQITANLWLKLSRLYSDCEDDTMHRYASEQALKEYKYSYENYNISEKQLQQMCYIIGDLYQQLGDLDNARVFFYMAKTNKAGTAVLKRHADLRLDDIKVLIRSQKQH